MFFLPSLAPLPLHMRRTFIIFQKITSVENAFSLDWEDDLFDARGRWEDMGWMATYKWGFNALFFLSSRFSFINFLDERIEWMRLLEEGFFLLLEFLVYSRRWLVLLHREVIMEAISLYQCHVFLHRLLAFIFCFDHVFIICSCVFTSSVSMLTKWNDLAPHLDEFFTPELNLISWNRSHIVLPKLIYSNHDNCGQFSFG